MINEALDAAVCASEAVKSTIIVRFLPRGDVVASVYRLEQTEVNRQSTAEEKG